MKTNYHPGVFITFKDELKQKERSLKTELKVLDRRRKQLVKEFMDLEKKIIDKQDELNRLASEKI